MAHSNLISSNIMSIYSFFSNENVIDVQLPRLDMLATCTNISKLMREDGFILDMSLNPGVADTIRVIDDFYCRRATPEQKTELSHLKDMYNNTTSKNSKVLSFFDFVALTKEMSNFLKESNYIVTNSVRKHILSLVKIEIRNEITNVSNEFDTIIAPILNKYRKDEYPIEFRPHQKSALLWFYNRGKLDFSGINELLFRHKTRSGKSETAAACIILMRHVNNIRNVLITGFTPPPLKDIADIINDKYSISSYVCDPKKSDFSPTADINIVMMSFQYIHANTDGKLDDDSDERVTKKSIKIS